MPLGDLRAKYSIASLAAFLENPHAVRPSGRMPGILNAKEAQAGRQLPVAGSGSRRAVAEHDLRLLRRAAGTGCRTSPAQADGHGEDGRLRPERGPPVGDNFALRFEGYLRIERAGEYRFHLTSDDGSKLFLDDKLVVANDGVHAPSTVSGSVKLTKGVHKLTADVFNAGGGVELSVEIEGPGLGRQDVTPLVTLTPEGNPKVAVKPIDPGEDDDFPIEPELAAKGRELFASLGCAGCHQLNAEQEAARVRLEGSPLGQAPSRGRLPGAGAGQGAALVFAQRRPAERPRCGCPVASARRLAPVPAEVVARTLTTFNCYACHERDKVGGPEEGFNSLFTTTQPEMGEEGRMPPPLDGVGAKLNGRITSRHILDQGAHDRPYMLTHMPGFGAANLPGLAAAFETLDKDTVEPVAKVTFTEPLAPRQDGGPAHGRRHVAGLRQVPHLRRPQGRGRAGHRHAAHAAASASTTGSIATSSIRRNCGPARACRPPGPTA